MFITELTLLDKFRLLIHAVFMSGGDSALKNAVAESGDQLYLIDNTLVFTLKGLYKLFEVDKNMSYRQFRASLYRGTLNKDLAVLGYTVVVYQSTSHIDSSWYQLRSI